MPARNMYHDAVVQALSADGWTITHDPFVLSYGGRDMYVDLGAERVVLGAEKDKKQIAVEIQSFLNPSPVRDLQEAIGQYYVYRSVMEESEPGRKLYLAVPRRVWEGILAERLGRLVVERLGLPVIVIDEKEARVIQWTG